MDKPIKRFQNDDTVYYYIITKIKIYPVNNHIISVFFLKLSIDITALITNMPY